MAFNLEQWASANELEPGTMTVLAEKGFKSQKSISQLTVEVIKKEFKGLVIGQQLLLIDAVSTLKSEDVHTAITQTAGSGTSGAGGMQQAEWAATASNAATTSGVGLAEDSVEGLNVTEVMKLLHMGNGNQVQQNKTGKPLIFDPFCDEYDATHSTAYRDIRDYISVMPKHTTGNEEPGVFTVGSHEFCLKDKRPPLDSINVAHYMEASLKILRELTIKEKLAVRDMLDYISYVIKIATMCQSFQWESILKYDLEYRKAQAELNFRWGADNAYLMQVLLKPSVSRSQRENQNKKSTSVSKGVDRYDPRSGKPVCRNWNKQSGCTLRICNYAHICAICFHPSHNSINHVTGYPPRQQASYSTTEQRGQYHATQSSIGQPHSGLGETSRQ